MYVKWSIDPVTLIFLATYNIDIKKNLSLNFLKLSHKQSCSNSTLLIHLVTPF
jgi:hypothetical protein